MSLCWIPYKEVHFFAQQGSFSYCCKHPDKLFLLKDFKTGKDILINNKLRDLKTSLYNGENPSVCNICWLSEKKNNISWRNQEGLVPKKFSNSETLLSENIYVDHVNLYFDNTCDLACVYCNTNFSSRWSNEIKNNTHLQHLTHIKNESNNQNTSTDAINKIVNFFEALGNLTLSKFLNITILGGEPLLSPQIKNGEFKKFLLAFYKHAPADFHCILTIHTNANTPKNVLTRFLGDFNNLKKSYPNLILKVVLSVDTVGTPSEFIRYGSSWKNVEENINLYFNTVEHIQFYPTFSVLNLYSFNDYINFLKKIYNTYQRPINIRSGLVYEPLMLNPYINENKKLNEIIEILDDAQSIFVKSDYVSIRERLVDIKNNYKIDKKSLDDLKNYFKYINISRHQDYVKYLGDII